MKVTGAVRTGRGMSSGRCSDGGRGGPSIRGVDRVRPPPWSEPMIARPALAAAVCEAGGLGTIGSDINPPDVLRNLIQQTKTLTKRPFGVDLIGDFVTDEHITVLVEEQVALAIFFWTLPTVEHVEQLKRAGVKVWMQIVICFGIDGTDRSPRGAREGDDRGAP
jgi:hypothetical protein